MKRKRGSCAAFQVFLKVGGIEEQSGLRELMGQFFAHGDQFDIESLGQGGKLAIIG